MNGDIPQLIQFVIVLITIFILAPVALILFGKGLDVFGVQVTLPGLVDIALAFGILVITISVLIAALLAVLDRMITTSQGNR